MIRIDGLNIIMLHYLMKNKYKIKLKRVKLFFLINNLTLYSIIDYSQ